MPRPVAAAILLSLLALSACKKGPPAAEGFAVADGLAFTLWAAEPNIVNPTNIAIDERGRIWVTEALNYRRHLKDLPDVAEEGDRILILEDTDGDGVADSRKVFDQSMELRAPLGIGVFGDKVYVSQSPDLWVYTKDENDNIVSKEKLLTGWGGVDHDHGLHAVTFGHDGRLWFNSGDQGFDVTDPSGKRTVSSPDGPYYAGTVLRMNPDGTDFAVFAHNFRNPYEMAMDSFGTVWQTDNDDDGNKWTRLNYVMEGGNFGYWGPGGKRWREDRGTHFHHELPGVVPDIARTGAGSPTGLVLYEGTLLPERYRGNLIHSEPGKRRLFSFFLEPSGAGYDMRAEETVAAEDPNWRPSDVAVAPDGSVFVADWYDPVVGGHNMRDTEKGRIYRLAPPGYLPKKAARLDLETPQGLTAAFRSPNPATHYRAWQELRMRGAEALPLLAEMWRGADPVLRARSLWLIGLNGGAARPEIDEALASPDTNFRILGLRVARLAGRDPVELASKFAADTDPRVRREAALALQHVPDERAVEPLAELAKGYDGRDRWYLEAWAIGARGKEEAVAARLLKDANGEFSPRLADFLWQLKPRDALPLLTKAVGDEKLSIDDRLRALRAIGDRSEPAAARYLAGLTASPERKLAEAAFDKLSRQLFSQWVGLRKDPPVAAAVRRALAEPALQAAALELTDALGDPAYGPDLLALARDTKTLEDRRARALAALGQTREARYLPALQEFADAAPATALRLAGIRGLANARAPDLDKRMEKLLFAENPNEVRGEALRIVGRNDEGLGRILDWAEKDELPGEVKSLATSLVHRSRDEDTLARAAKLLPLPKDKANNTLPANPYEIVNRTGDAAKGELVFRMTDGPKCSSCHSLDDKKELAGPNLSAIGSKYDKRGLLDSILTPSAGIAPEYYVHILDTTTQGPVVGVLAEDTPERIVVRNEFGEEIRLAPAEVLDRRKSNLSMMPEDIVGTMTEQQLVDLLEYLTTLTAGGRT